MKHFYIFRHGETDMNIKKLIQGQKFDCELNENGKKQAKTIIPLIKKLAPEIIYSSTLKRACQTAKIIANALDIPVINDRAFIECNFGNLEGKAWDQSKDAIYGDWSTPDFCFPEGESIKQIEERIVKRIKDIIINTKYAKIGIATHGGIIKVLGIYCGKPIDIIDNGCVVHLTYNNESFDIEKLSSI